MNRLELRFPLLVFLASRVGLGLVGWLGLSFTPELVVPGGAKSLRDSPWLDALYRWDCGWYSRIASEGYVDLNMANFWPLLPGLTALVTRLGIQVEVAQILVAATFHLGALVVLYRLFSRLSGVTAARWAIVLYAAYPFAFFQAVPYPEGMLTCLSAAAVLAAVEGRTRWVALWLALAVLARHVGAFTLIAVVPVLWLGSANKPLGTRVARLWPVLVVPLVFVAWAAYLQGRFNVPLAFVKSRELWGPMAYWSVTEWAEPRTHLEHKVFIVVSVVLAVGGFVLVASSRLRWVGLMGWAMMGLLWAVGVAALARYSSSVWPFFLGLGILMERFPRLSWIVFVSVALQAFWFGLYAHQWWIF